MGWSGRENGELLQLAADNGFDAFISTDKGLQYEHNQSKLPLAIVVLMARNNKLRTLEALMPQVVARLSTLKGNELVKIKASKQ